MIYTVEFDVSGHGTAPETQYIEVVSAGDAASVTEPAAPSDSDYLFLGWFTDSLMTKEWNFSEDRIYRSTTLYAGWKRVTPDWHGNRHSETFTFKKVSWKTWQEHETYDYITNGNIEQSEDTDTKIMGTLDFEGYELPSAEDLIRIFYSFKDDNGIMAEVAVATMFVAYPRLKYTDTLKGIKANGTLECSSVLSAAHTKHIGMPKTIPKNSNAIYEAEQLLLECGLQTSAEPSPFSLSVDHTFDADTSYLDMVNWLLSAAGYTEAFPDEYGIVQLKSYASAQQRKDYTVFANNDESIMYPELEEANDWQSTPNVVRMIYNTDDACIVAYAENISGSRASLDARGGREITYFEEVSDISGSSKANALKEMAEKKLLELSSDIEYVTFEHAYVPMSVYDPVKIMYSDLEWAGNANNMSVNLSPSTKTQTKVKRVITENIEIRSGATVYRGG